MGDDKLREIAEAATPGPWQWSEEISAQHLYGDYLGALSPDGKPVCLAMSIGNQEGQDARFIATFNPSVVLAMLDELALLRDVAEAAKDLADVSHYEWCDAVKFRRRQVPPPECDCGVRHFLKALTALRSSREGGEKKG